MKPLTGSSAEIDALERRIVDHLFVLQPSYAVSLGLHEYDGRVPDLSPASTERWATVADGLLGELEATGTLSLSPERRTDRFLLRLLLESPLFDLRELKELDRNPMAYVGSVSLTPYLVREYAPPERRAAAISELLESVPRLFEYGRRRLRGPLPRPFVDLSLAIGSGLPAHFAEAESFSNRTNFGPLVTRARGTAEEALALFLGWLREEELPRATADFALGGARYQRLLLVREGIDTPFDDLRQTGEADLARNQARLAELASAEGASVEALIERTHRHHPSATDLLSTARSYVEETRRFVATHQLATIPEPAVCRVEETPVWSRSLSTASMNPPGPFDTASSEGIFYVTPVDPKWTPTQSEEWLRSLSHAMLRNIAVHEVYPGHYLQFLHFRRSSGSLARKVYLSPSFVEGWAHYAEQLAIEQGLGRESHAAEVAQIHDALLRDCRLLASVGLHTQSMSVEAATELFQREGHFDRLPAEREAIRGTFNPEYYCYTLGKMAILDARRRFLSPRFGGQLRAFHDALLGAGCPPIGLLESVFTGNLSR
jgi:uncharacterized protein (DUF885 family)